MRLTPLPALLALAGLAALAQEVPQQPPPASMTGEQQPPADAPPPTQAPGKAADAPGLAAASTAKADPKAAEQAEALPVFLRHLAGVGAAWGPAPSPDGTRVAFVTTLFGSRQAALIPTQSGYPVQLTDEPGGVLSVRFAPQDAHLVFATVLRGGERRVILIDDAGSAPQEIDKSPGHQLIGGFSRDGKRLLFAVVDGANVALKWFAIDARQATALQPPLPQAGTPPTPAGAKPPVPIKPLKEALEGLVGLTGPSQDGRLALAHVRRGADEQLVSIELATTRTDVITPHEGAARFRQARFSPDSKSVYVLTDAGRDLLGVDAITIADKKRKAVYAPKAEIEAFALADDGHKLIAAQVSGGETLFTLLELPSLRQQPLPQPPPGALQHAAPGELPLAWSRGGDRVYFAWGRADDTVDVYVLRADFGSAQRLTRSPRPGLPEGSLPRPKTVQYPSFDGRQIPALLWAAQPLAKGDQAARPRVAVVVGGTQARPVLDTRVAALSAAGIASLAPSLRGSEGRGKAHAIEDSKGAAQDVAFAARWLRDHAEVDGARPLLVGIGPGVDVAVAAAQADPGAWAGVVLLGEDRPRGVRLKVPHLALSGHGASTLAQVAAFAKERFDARASASKD